MRISSRTNYQQPNYFAISRTTTNIAAPNPSPTSISLSPAAKLTLSYNPSSPQFASSPSRPSRSTAWHTSTTVRGTEPLTPYPTTSSSARHMSTTTATATFGHPTQRLHAVDSPVRDYGLMVRASPSLSSVSRRGQISAATAPNAGGTGGTPDTDPVLCALRVQGARRMLGPSRKGRRVDRLGRIGSQYRTRSTRADRCVLCRETGESGVTRYERMRKIDVYLADAAERFPVYI